MGQIFGHLVLQIQFSLLGQLQHRHGGDGFGHGGDAENGIGAKGLFLLRVLQAKIAPIEQLSPLQHRHGSAANPLGLNIFLYSFGNIMLQQPGINGSCFHFIIPYLMGNLKSSVK